MFATIIEADSKLEGSMFEERRASQSKLRLSIKLDSRVTLNASSLARAIPTPTNTTHNYTKSITMSAEFEAVVKHALQDLADKEFRSVRAAAKFHGVDKRTLMRRKNGGSTRRNARVKQQLLTTLQEKLLVRWILDLDRCANAPTHAQVRDMAFKSRSSPEAQITLEITGPLVSYNAIPSLPQR
jgi:cellulose biosynthesis protein BcsQ